MTGHSHTPSVMLPSCSCDGRSNGTPGEVLQLILGAGSKNKGGPREQRLQCMRVSADWLHQTHAPHCHCLAYCF